MDVRGTPGVVEVARSLRNAEASRVPIGPPSAADPALTLDAAYRIQRINIDLRLSAGEVRVGHKVGLTSLAMQRQLGVDRPDFGVITDRMVLDNDGTVPLDQLIAPRVEAEFAFRMARDVPPAPSLAELRAAIGGVALALEIIDSRVADWKIALVDTIADNASSARIVHGPFLPATPELLAALPQRTLRLTENGAERAAGPGSAVLGDPLLSLQWLASAIGAFGEGLAAGDIILAGAVAAAVPLTAGAVFAALSQDFQPAVARTSAAT